MSETTLTRTPPSSPLAENGYARALAVAVAAAAVLVLRLPLSAGNGHQTWSDIVITAVFAAVGLVIAFGAVLPKALHTSPQTAAWCTVGLAVLAVLSLVVFFSPAPLVIGYAAWFLSRTPLVSPVSGTRTRAAGIVGLVVLALTVAWSVYAMVVYWAPSLPTK